MALVDFTAFSKKVLAAVEGKLSAKEIGILDRMFTRVKKRNLVLAAGLLSALRAGGATKADVQRLSKILEDANDRIYDGRKPFTQTDEKELARIFHRASLPQKAEARFKHNVDADADDLLASELASSIRREEQEAFSFVPEKKLKKAPTLPEPKEKEKTSARRG
jgi:hypothetical protein